MKRLDKFISLSASERRLLLEAVIDHCLARVAILVLPFRWIGPILGRHMGESPDTVEPEQNEVGERVRWAVNAVARRVPWKSTCLVESIAAKLMLRRRGIPCTLYLGAARDDSRQICYHAWVRSGDSIVAGGPIEKSYKVVSTFGEPGK